MKRFITLLTLVVLLLLVLNLHSAEQTVTVSFSGNISTFSGSNIEPHQSCYIKGEVETNKMIVYSPSGNTKNYGAVWQESTTGVSGTGGYTFTVSWQTQIEVDPHPITGERGTLYYTATGNYRTTFISGDPNVWEANKPWICLTTNPLPYKDGAWFQAKLDADRNTMDDILEDELAKNFKPSIQLHSKDKGNWSGNYQVAPEQTEIVGTDFQLDGASKMYMRYYINNSDLSQEEISVKDFFQKVQSCKPAREALKLC